MMGDFEKERAAESVAHNPRSLLKAVILLVLAIFAPVMANVNTWEIFQQITIQSMFWMWSSNPYMPSFYGFSLMEPYMLTSMWPFLLLRMAPVSMMFRYYTEKTTRKRAFLASCVGDGIFIAVSIPMLLTSILFGSGYFILPLPIQMIVAILILWRFPLPEPTAPWKEIEESKSWWEKDQDTKERKSNDEDELW